MPDLANKVITCSRDETGLSAQAALQAQLSASLCGSVQSFASTFNQSQVPGRPSPMSSGK